MPEHKDKKKAPPAPKKITAKQRAKLPPGLIKAMEKKNERKEVRTEHVYKKDNVIYTLTAK